MSGSETVWQVATAAGVMTEVFRVPGESPQSAVFRTFNQEQVAAMVAVVEAAFAAGVASVDVAKIADHAHGMGQDEGARDAFNASARILRQRANDRIDACDGGSGAKALEQAAVVIEEQGLDL